MERISKKIEVLTLLFLGLMFIGLNSTYAKELRVLREKTFDTKPGETLQVEASGADVKVESWDKNQAYVKIMGTDKVEDDFRLEIEKVDDGIRVVAKKRTSSWFSFWSWGNYNVKIEVILPKNYNTQIETSGGDISISEVNGSNNLNTSGGDVTLRNSIGELSVKTSGGDIKLKDHNGRTMLSTSGGDISAMTCIGDVQASTSGGDVDLDINDGRIKTKTSGGDINIQYSGANKGIEASTSGGDIHIRVPSSFKADVSLVASGGDIDNNFSNSRTSKVTRSRLRAEYNGGGSLLECRTSGGGIRVDEM